MAAGSKERLIKIIGTKDRAEAFPLSCLSAEAMRLQDQQDEVGPSTLGPSGSLPGACGSGSEADPE